MAKEDVVLITGISGFIGARSPASSAANTPWLGSTGLAHRILLRRHTLSALT